MGCFLLSCFLLCLPSSLQSILGPQITFIHFKSWPNLKGVEGEVEGDLLPKEIFFAEYQKPAASNVGELWKNKSEQSFQIESLRHCYHVLTETKMVLSLWKECLKVILESKRCKNQNLEGSKPKRQLWSSNMDSFTEQLSRSFSIRSSLYCWVIFVLAIKTNGMLNLGGTQSGQAEYF